MSIMGTITAATRTFRGAGAASVLSAPRQAPEPRRRWQTAPTRAETLECTCPDFCERDHEQD